MEEIVLTDEFIENFNAAQLDQLYSDIYPFKSGLAYVSKYDPHSAKWSKDADGLINEHGELVIPCEYKIYPYFNEGTARVEKNGKYGFVNAQGPITPIIYEDCGRFNDGLAIVVKDSKSGYINLEGEEVIPCTYEAAYDFSEGLAVVKKNGKYGYINNKGDEVIPCIYRDAHSFFEGLAWVMNDDIKIGFINSEGDTIVPFDYVNISNYFFNGHISAMNRHEHSHAKCIINQKGEQITPFIYGASFENVFHEGLGRVWRDGYGFIDSTGKEVIPCIYDEADRFSDGLALVSKDGVPMFIDKKGKVVLSEELRKYNILEQPEKVEFWDGLAKVVLNGKLGFINKKGEEIIPCIYEQIVYIYSDDFKNKSNADDTAAFATYFSEGLACVKKDGKWGFINMKGEEVIPFEFDDANYFSEGLAPVKKDGIWGLVDKKGNSTFKGANYEKLVNKKKEDDAKKIAEEENFKKSLPDFKSLFLSFAFVQNDDLQEIDLEKLGFTKNETTEYLSEFNDTVTQAVYLLEKDDNHYCKIEYKPGYESVYMILTIEGYPNIMQEYKDEAEALKSSSDFQQYGINPWMEIGYNKIEWGDGL